MKIQKIPVDSQDAVVFSVNETEYSAKDGWASISIPSGTFKGKGRVRLLLAIVPYTDHSSTLCLSRRSDTSKQCALILLASNRQIEAHRTSGLGLRSSPLQVALFPHDHSYHTTGNPAC